MEGRGGGVTTKAELTRKLGAPIKVIHCIIDKTPLLHKVTATRKKGRVSE